MVLFRPQRGTIEEAMKEVTEVNSLQDIKNIMDKNSYLPKRPIEAFSIKHYTYDKRIDWDTWLVCIDNNAIGFTNGELK